jgi:hypothetical protein
MPWITAIWIALSAASSAEPTLPQRRSRTRPHFRVCVSEQHLEPGVSTTGVAVENRLRVISEICQEINHMTS